MKMSKDPAVLFYTSDFLTGTMTLSDEQVGKYIRLLCLQHQKSSLSEKDMLYICKTYDEDVFNKFVKDENGMYYNERMRIEIEKRQKYSESRRKNRAKKDMNKTCKTYDQHMENENVNKDITINKEDNSVNVNLVSERWNQIVTSLPKVSRLTEQRKKSIKAKKATLEEFEEVFKKVESSDFLSGRNKKWLACGFDWVLEPRNWTKIIEGNYDRQEFTQQKSKIATLKDI